MASHGNTTNNNKFVSINLNKSFGQSTPFRNNNHPPPPSHYNGTGGGGGGRVRSDGMVVLSRPRTSQKVAPKLSVPPPLNLPSLRKEHEKFDSNGPGGTGPGGAGAGSGGSRPNSSGIGWTKPAAAVVVQDKVVVDDDQSVGVVGGKGSEGSRYMPPSGRVQSYVPSPAMEKAMVLRGEDFPSLKAALPTPSGNVQKQRDNVQQKQKDVKEESSNELKGNYSLNNSSVYMRPQGQYSSSNDQGRSFVGGNQVRKQEDYPLPLVRLNPRSDWADDERDTGHGFVDHGRDHGFSRNESHWDRDLDMPRTSILSQKPMSNNTFERPNLRGDEGGKGHFSEVLKVDPYYRDGRTSARESSNWRSSPKDGANSQEVVNERNSTTQATVPNRETGRETKYIPPAVGDSNRNGGFTGNGESAKRDSSLVQEGRQHWNHTAEFSNKGSEQRDRFGAEQSGRYRVDASQNRTISKHSFSSGGRGPSMSDPIRSFGRERLPLPKTDRPYLEDPLLKDLSSTGFDEGDPFSGVLGVIKRKKEAVKQSDFHDPVRESFEAELERVQKMQEMERQRIVEEQERVLEQARREEEERQRLIREDEERQRRLEQEAQEAAWREEQERLEAARRAEEQKIAREEEKKRIYIEEERRKIAAKQKLLELEAKIAQRRAETEKGDVSGAVVNEKVSIGTKEANDFAEADLDDWEDSERMVERITTSASSDSSALNRPFVMNYRVPPGESSSGYLERGKAVNSWRQNVFDNGSSLPFAMQDQNNGQRSPTRDASVGGRAFSRKEFYGGPEYISSSTYPKGALQESHPGNRWTAFGDGDPFNRNRETFDSYENASERYSDAAWGQGNTRVNPHSPYPERLYPYEDDELYSYGKSRYSMRQPRVLPPPSMASLHKPSLRSENEHHGPSTSVGNKGHHSYVARSETAPQTDYYEESDESRDPPTMHASGEEKGSFLTGTDSIILKRSGEDTVLTAPSSISVGEDEEWTLDKNEEMQEQEEYDEDGYLEEDEVHEVDDENIDLAHEFDSVHLEDKGSSHMMDNLVLGFDEGVEVGLPNDEFERNPDGDETNLELPEVVGSVEEQRSVDGRQSNRENLQPVACSPQTSMEIALNSIGETDRTAQEPVVVHPVSAPTSLEPDVLNKINSSSGSEVPVLNSVPSSVNIGSHPLSSQPITSGASSVPNQPDPPVKLQFGLFTGPSLIPSPVPAIQIGSIQMPLHLHLPVDPSITHLQSSPSPLFQFGQLRYTSPISQGILPMPPQSASFVQSNMQHSYNLNQSSGGGSLPIQPSRELQNRMNHEASSVSVNNQPSVVSRASDLSEDDGSRALKSFSPRRSTDSSALVHTTRTDVQHAVGNKNVPQSVFQAKDKEHLETVVKNLGQSNEKRVDAQLPSSVASEVAYCEKDFNAARGQGAFSGNKTRKSPYPVSTCGFRSSFPAPEISHLDSSGFQRRPRRAVQRTEFRVRQSSGLVPSNNSGLDDKSNLSGRGFEVSTRSGFKSGTMASKPFKQVVESDTLSSAPTSSQELNSGNKVTNVPLVEVLPGVQATSLSREGNMKRNILEEDVDALSQGGVVHVFKQSGIEAPSDEDDFIEVRSKRQMLNDRREQREKEIKAKSRIAKPPRKPRSSAQNTVVSNSLNKVSASLGREPSHNAPTGLLISDRQRKVNKEVNSGFTPMASQQLAPIGTPTLNTESHSETRSHTKSFQAGSVQVVSGAGKEIDSVQTPLGSWANAQISQQVMALTQTQLDEAMKPARFETHVSPIGSQSTSELISASSSNLPKDKPKSSSASPINSLLAGEKIQFGAVTSPTVLPSSRVVSLGVGAPGTFLSDVQMSRNIKTQNDCSLSFEKDKFLDESCGHLENCKDEAEAAASAVAVAAIGSDKIVGNGFSSVLIPDAKNIGVGDFHRIAEGVAGDQLSGTQSRAEESLSVSLPADLSVETPPMSLWPPLPSPQNSSSQMFSHFPGAPPSPFPFYEMNPMLSGPIFAFKQHEESGGTQSESQKSTLLGQGHPGTWQQCHPSVESFYGPPAGFSGPFISPPGVIPGVQAPHMFVYNHYARLGQFGQVGLSFMGASYMPSGKQPEWKHNATSSGGGISEGEINNMNMVSTQRTTSTMPAPMQHLAPGSPLLPMASPMPMFDVSPFQSGPDVSVQGRWPHVPAMPIQSVPLSLPLQQQAEAVLPSQFSHGHPVEQLQATRFTEFQNSAPSDIDRTFPVVTDARVTQPSDEIASVEKSSFSAAGTSTRSSVKMGERATTSTGNSDGVPNDSTDTASISSFKHRNSQQKNLSSQRYSNSTGYGYQKGSASQKGGSAGEFSHRRMGGFHRRNYSLGAEKNSSTSKVRQIYVAKQTSGSSTGG